VCVFVAGSAVAQQRAPESFTDATTAFTAGDYARALTLFEAERARGADTAAVAYNIGVCQYRLGDYADAVASFRSLAQRFAEFRALAEYNRGLALRALNRRKEAGAAFEAARTSEDDRLAALATDALADLRATAPATTSRWQSYFSVAVGHDDNVALVDQLSLPASVSADSPLTELVGYASHELAGRVPLRLDFSGYVVRYAADHAFDQDSLRFDAVFHWRAADHWTIEASPYLASSTLDGDGFERTLGAQLRALRSFGEQLTFDARFAYDDIDSPATRFAFVAGHRERLRFGIEHATGLRRLRVYYEHEVQDRADPGVSPYRDRLAASITRPLLGRWLMDGGISRRASRYEALVVPRDERLVELAFTARRELRAGWALNMDYRWADNASNVSQFGYTSRRISAGVSRAFRSD
jgi:tetratricopeptide (TPR) repeat protein